ncbi:Dolichyl-diphosphooligosaccharide--protein glycosyltransferase subunit DAD1 [Gryllus bimaculatus]|nr:Dolichyl-diphosphooligosaccharide--protein glycosyltransferase subunit DAD1 [Gryllus bimaculatus]
MANLSTVIGKFYGEYVNNTPKKLKIIDSYLLYVFLTGVIQFVYCCLVGTFPFNSFLSGFISCVSCFVLAVCLRLQVNPQNKNQKRVCRFHLCPYNSTHCRHELHWLNYGWLERGTSILNNQPLYCGKSNGNYKKTNKFCSITCVKGSGRRV